MGKPMGRPKASWQLKLLELRDHKKKEITLSEIAEKLDLNRRFISQTLCRIIQGRKEYIYDTQELYEAVRNKLEEGNT
jgi:NADH/NAD ratio-sensing transcriptional regulator Rex